MKHNRVPRFTHTFVIYEADALPEKYRGVLFGVAPLLNHVVMSAVEPRRLVVPDPRHRLRRDDARTPGSGPSTSSSGPDGALYIADWYDRQVEPLPQPRGPDRPGIGPDLPADGRSRPRRGTPRRPAGSPSTTELVDQLSDPNRWVRQTALRLIGDRKDASIAPVLKRMIREGAGSDRRSRRSGP